MDHRPVIAITPVPRDVDTGYGRDRADTVARGFGDAVVAAGGLPLSLPQVAAELAPAQLEHVDGLVLSGGQDIDLPGATGEDRWIDAARDRHEFALWEAARARNLPVLGVCRGLQLVNVALGGTLIGHVEGHDAADRHAEELQEVEVEAGTLLAGILGAFLARGVAPLEAAAAAAYVHGAAGARVGRSKAGLPRDVPDRLAKGFCPSALSLLGVSLPGLLNPDLPPPAPAKDLPWGLS